MVQLGIEARKGIGFVTQDWTGLAWVSDYNLGGGKRRYNVEVPESYAAGEMIFMRLRAEIAE